MVSPNSLSFPAACFGCAGLSKGAEGGISESVGAEEMYLHTTRGRRIGIRQPLFTTNTVEWLFYRLVLFAFADAFGEQKFYLSVDGAEVVFRPCRDFIIQRGGKSQGYLFLRFLLVVCRFRQNKALFNISSRC